MQAFTAPFPARYSAHTNPLQSASQTRPKRWAILSASLPIPPMGGTTGEAKVDGLQLGSAQASPIFTGSYNNEPAAIVDVHSHDQSLVLPLHRSLDFFQKHISNYNQTSTPNSDATQTKFIHHETIDENRHNTPPANSQSNILNVHTTNHRDLTPNFETVVARCGNMISTISTPGSPPELCESRSSKSSSYCSQFSTENDLGTEITNFEDIGLDDDNKIDVERRYDASVHNKIGPRRDTHQIQRLSATDISNQPKLRTTIGASRSGVAHSMRYGFTNSSTVVLSGQDTRPRSSSPPKRIPRSTSAYSVNLGGSALGPSPPTSTTPSRRSSWQPQRKTIAEIEAEYHDSDDDLPDDANLWNVPISPFQSTNVSPRSSFLDTSEKKTSITDAQPIPLEHPRSVTEVSVRNSTSLQPVQRQKIAPRSSSISQSRSNPTSPRIPTHIRNGRAKSWNLAMADLSPEARIVTQNLECHAGISKAKEGECTKSVGSTNQRSAPSTIQLPPIQRGPLDFMPISKEKEAVLSRTRPSWLPPKDPREEQRHLKEYQQMMLASIEAEKKKVLRLKNIQCEKDNTRESLNRIWDFYVNPTTDITIIDRRVNDLCWHGIPSRVRGKVWQRAVGNSLGLTTKTYTKALDRAKAIKTKSPQELSRHEKTISSWFLDIDRDVETAFPELGFFQRNGPLWQDLTNVCEAYACYRSDIGYFYGLQLVGALVLLQISDPSEAFVLMANCLNKPIPLAFHSCDIASSQRTYNRVMSNLGVKFPRLHDYLFEPMERGGLGFTGQEVFEPMFKTLFANGLDFDRLCRVWDIWIFEGDRTLIRTAVAILGSLQSQIFDTHGDLHLKRRNVQEMLGWGPFNRTQQGSYWNLQNLGNQEAFIEEINTAGKLDYTGR